MRTKLTLVLAMMILAVAPMLADVEAESATETATLAATAEGEAVIVIEPVALSELIDGFIIPATPGVGGGCASGSCNEDRDCYHLRRECPFGTFPACYDETGSGCDGYCACGWD